MTRVFAIFTLLLALVAVTVPSVVVGARGFVEHPAPVLILQANGNYVKAPCLLSGSGRLLPCQSDTGVMPPRLLLVPPTAEPAATSLSDAMPGAFSAEPGLPPPRRA